MPTLAFDINDGLMVIGVNVLSSLQPFEEMKRAGMITAYKTSMDPIGAAVTIYGVIDKYAVRGFLEMHGVVPPASKPAELTTGLKTPGNANLKALSLDRETFDRASKSLPRKVNNAVDFYLHPLEWRQAYELARLEVFLWRVKM